MEHLFTVESLISLLTLSLLEVILGIDNVIFVSIIMGRMAEEHRKRARTLWMIFGIITRSLLLMALGWLLTQKGKPLFTLPVIDKGIDIASLVMILGGLFLLAKTVREIHHKLEDDEDGDPSGPVGGLKKNFSQGMVQIVLVDMVFSFDSVVTASGVAQHLEIMIAAVVLAMIIMFLFSPRISAFIEKHPTLKMLALSFLVMIGLVLVVEGWAGETAENLHLKNYVYFAMAFSFSVELLNMRIRKKRVRSTIVETLDRDEPGQKG
jgi:predicted tellurium resistance membrane protein TerC